MYIGWPGQNCVAGGARFQITHDTVTSGPFTAGEEISGATSAASATVERVDTSNLKLYCIARDGNFVVGEVINGLSSSASATTTVVGAYDAPVGRFDNTTSTATTTGYAEATQGYRLADSVEYTVNTSSIIAFDRGGSWNASGRLIEDPTFCLISGWAVDDYNQIDGTTNLTSVIIEGDSVEDFSGATTIATITDGSPTYGGGAFAQRQLFVSFAAAAYQYLRVRITSSASVGVTIGNIWIGAGTDTRVDEGWSFRDGFTLTNINRNVRTDLWGGGTSDVARESIREFSGMGSFNQASFDKFLDTTQGAQTIYNEPQNPLAIAFDQDSDARAVTGAHYFSGLWKYNGNPVASDAGVRRDGVYFWPNVRQSWREHR